MLRILLIVSFFLTIFTDKGQAQDYSAGTFKYVDSISLEGGYIATKHFQSDDENFRERHGLGILKVDTKGYGNWALYFLNPNSVRDTSFGFGYVTNPYVIDLGITDLELYGALGLVTGYQDYPVPLIAAQARLKLFEVGQWNAGISMAAMPYYAEDDRTGDSDFGIVGTTPFLSLRYSF